jgi:hypothetical protein
MTSPLNNKRTSDFYENPAKKIQLDPSSPLLGVLRLCNNRLPIDSLIKMSLVNKEIASLVQSIFSEKAKIIGLHDVDNSLVKKKWAQLDVLQTKQSFTNFLIEKYPPSDTSTPFLSTPLFKCLKRFACLSLTNILDFLSAESNYKIPNHPLFEVLERENHWIKAQKKFQKILKESSSSEAVLDLPSKFESTCHLSLCKAASYGKRVLVNQLLEFHAPIECSGTGRIVTDNPPRDQSSLLERAFASKDIEIITTMIEYLVAKQMKRGIDELTARRSVQEGDPQFPTDNIYNHAYRFYSPEVIDFLVEKKLLQTQLVPCGNGSFIYRPPNE